MSALTTAKPENISNLLNMDQEYPAPPIVAGKERRAGALPERSGGILGGLRRTV